MQEDGSLKTPTRTSCVLSALLLSLLSVGKPSVADAPAGPPASSAGGPAQADELIGQAEQTLKGATSLTADFQEIDAYPGTYRDLKQAGTVSLSRPNKLDIEIERFRRVSAADPWAPSGNNAKSVSDGTTYTYAFLHPHSTQVQQSLVDPTALRSALRGLPSLAGFFQSQADSKLPGQSGPASALPDATWDGGIYHVIQYPVSSRDSADSAVATAYIGSDLLIHRLLYTATGLGGTATREWTLDHILLDPQLSDSQFHYDAPKDATTLDNSDLADVPSPGAAAPDFTVYAPDGKAVKLSDYRGKTVILDFWATWCWPCNQSLPHTEAIAKQYKDRGVVVVAVAVRDSKAGFDAWLKKHNYPDIDFLYEPRPQGQDAASTLYGVSTTPTAYVIDSTGTVVQSIEGYTGPSNELASAVTSALDRSPDVADAK
jgi:peroxiredoxin